MGADEEGTLVALKAHRQELVDPLIAQHQGDGLLIKFASIVDAVRCAVVLQQGMKDRNANLDESQSIRIRLASPGAIAEPATGLASAEGREATREAYDSRRRGSRLINPSEARRGELRIGELPGRPELLSDLRGRLRFSLSLERLREAEQRPAVEAVVAQALAINRFGFRRLLRLEERGTVNMADGLMPIVRLRIWQRSVEIIRLLENSSAPPRSCLAGARSRRRAGRD